jgi:hypothetical protein
MNDTEARDFISQYFYELFVNRKIDMLDEYLSPDYRDDDIDPGETDHRANSKRYLAALFQKHPDIAVEIGPVAVADEVICAYLVWHETRNGEKHILKKGVGIFELENYSIRRRHNYIYFEDNEGKDGAPGIGNNA